MAACVACLAPLASVSAADLKIGVVDLQRVVEASPQAEAARSKLEKEFSGRASKLQAAQKEFKANEDKLTKDGAIMSETERNRLERELVNKQRDLKRDLQEYQEDYNFRQNEEMRSIQQLIGEATVALSKEQQFDLVLAKQAAVFSNPKLDISEQVIERLKKGGK